MKIQWKKLILCLIVPLAVGGLSALLTSGGMDVFGMLRKPPLSPPGWLFPVVWTILYILMGIASYLVLVSSPSPGMQTVKRLVTENSLQRTALAVDVLQLGFNFIWPIIFFGLRLYLVAFVWLVLLWLLILKTALLFYRISKTAGYLMLPYLVWVIFAGYLNLAIYFLN